MHSAPYDGENTQSSNCSTAVPDNNVSDSNRSGALSQDQWGLRVQFNTMITNASQKKYPRETEYSDNCAIGEVA